MLKISGVALLCRLIASCPCNAEDQENETNYVRIKMVTWPKHRQTFFLSIRWHQTETIGTSTADLDVSTCIFNQSANTKRVEIEDAGTPACHPFPIMVILPTVRSSPTASGRYSTFWGHFLAIQPGASFPKNWRSS